MKEIRLLKKSEIRLRVGNFVESQYGVYVNLLAHTDARTCSKILDETFGVLGWQRGYQGINNELFCEVSVWDEEKKQWNKKDVEEFDKFLYENLTKRGRAIRRNKKRAKAWKIYNDYVPTLEDSLKWYGNKKRIPKDTLTISVDSIDHHFINTK